jgi:hypothetical protein
MFKVFTDFFKSDNLGAHVQLLYEKELLHPAIQEATGSHLRYVRRQVSRFKGFKDGDLQDFLRSPGFRVFVDSEWASDIWYLMKSGTLSLISDNLSDLQLLSNDKFSNVYEDVDSYFEARFEKDTHRRREVLESRQQTESCMKNMEILMKARQRYNRLYREDIDLRDPVKLKKLLKLIGLSGLECPSGGVYDTTTYGWVRCDKHGKARIPKYE